MGWDDSDDSEEEDIDFEKQIEEKKKAAERQRRRDEGLSSESEREEAPKPAAAKAKPKPKAATKPQAEDEEKNLTPAERKLLQRKREEEQSARLAEDLFAGCDLADEAKEAQEKKRQEEVKKEAAAKGPQIVYNDAFERVELKVQKDVDNLITTVAEKITAGTAKAGASIFCTNILKQLESSLTLEDLDQVQKAIGDLMKVKQEQKAETQTIEKKANTKLSKTTKFNTHSEWEDVYGGGADDEEWTPEEWAAWEAGDKGGSAPAAAKGAKW